MPFSRLLAFSLLATLVAAQDLPERSARVSTYRMKVELDPVAKTITGTQRITWTNTTARPTDELRLHLYINAFRNLDSTFMREADESFRQRWRPGEFGFVRIDQVELVDGADSVDLTEQLTFIQPDDGNVDDATVARIPLPDKVRPGESVTIVTRFRTKLPKAYRRTGWVPGGSFFCMHWFPKLGVLEDVDGAGVWNCHQFHANSEFFADFSVYEVEITVPDENYAEGLGATGERVDTRPQAGGGFTVVHRAEDVHDFAWVTDPDFVRHDAMFDPRLVGDDPVLGKIFERLRTAPGDANLPRTKIVLLLRPEHDTVEQRDRHLRAVKSALAFYGTRYGAYPYRTITAVDPGRDALGNRLGGGMEYPNLITCGTDLFPHPRQPVPEGVTVHEFGHQYWYGLSANNEFEESWLDEGINTYSEGRAQWLDYGATMRPVQTTQFGSLTLACTPGLMADSLGLEQSLTMPLEHALIRRWQHHFTRLGFSGTLMPRSPLLDVLRTQPTATYFREAAYSDGWNDRRRWLDAATPDAMVHNGWEYVDSGSYNVNSYTRPATLLRTLERLVGAEKWWDFMRRFHARARFTHPTTADFAQLLAETCGTEVAAFFDQAIGAQANFDYGIERIEPPNGDGAVKHVLVRRKGVLSADVDVRFRFAGREQPVTRRVAKDEPYPIHRFTFDDAAEDTPYGRLLEVWIDPPVGTPGTGEAFEFDAEPAAGVYLIDENLLDNAWRARPDPMPGLRRGIRLLLQTQSHFSFGALIG